MAKVIRLDPGGSSTVEESGLSFEQAKERAARLAAADKLPGCAWCVGLDDEDDTPVRSESGEDPL